MLSLLATRRFGPLFATQFLGAFNDNLYKTAMLFLITFGLMRHDPKNAAVLVTLAAGLFILPFFLFSSLAGQLADSLDKARVIRWVKGAEILIMMVGAFALSHDSITLLMLVLFAMGVHSTIFGPIKYAILPQHLGRGEVLAGTGLVEAGTYVAILSGQVVGGLIGTQAAWAVLATACVGFLSGRAVPTAPPQRTDVKVDWNIAAASWQLVRHIAADRQLIAATIAISWFWAMGAVFTSQFLPLVEDRLHASEAVATLFLAVFTVGVALGSITVSRLLNGVVSARFAPAAAVAVSLFVVYLVIAVQQFPVPAVRLDLAGFVGRDAAWHILAALFGLAAAAGVFVVPLYALLQTGCAPSERARVIAANNIVNSAFMVLATLVSAALVGAGLSVSSVLLTVGAANLVAVPYTLRLRREAVAS